MIHAPRPSVQVYGSRGETDCTRSSPLMSGAARAARSSASGDVVPMAPFCDPWSRRCRVSLRVSTSVIPTTPCCARYASSDCSLRQFDGAGLASRTTKPATRGLESTASVSAAFTPVLPICGAVIVTICP